MEILHYMRDILKNVAENERGKRAEMYAFVYKHVQMEFDETVLSLFQKQIHHLCMRDAA